MHCKNTNITSHILVLVLLLYSLSFPGLGKDKKIVNIATSSGAYNGLWQIILYSLYISNFIYLFFLFFLCKSHEISSTTISIFPISKGWSVVFSSQSTTSPGSFSGIKDRNWWNISHDTSLYKTFLKIIPFESIRKKVEISSCISWRFLLTTANYLDLFLKGHIKAETFSVFFVVFVIGWVHYFVKGSHR